MYTHTHQKLMLIQTKRREGEGGTEGGKEGERVEGRKERERVEGRKEREREGGVRDVHQSQPTYQHVLF